MPQRIIAFVHRTPRWIRNKYSITIVVFFFYMMFFDQNDIISLIQLRGELSELEENKTYYKKQIEITKNDLNDLLTNDENLEKFAREKYLMKKENEEIFIVVEK